MMSFCVRMRSVRIWIKDLDEMTEVKTVECSNGHVMYAFAHGGTTVIAMYVCFLCKEIKEP